ncbi:hypothetical protein [Nocardia otitidiscaviarum]|uniref:hypothetical protein n=1 Tax=Nocardia otitidiscaviarum TaxID=1823 RepID=UPI002458D213|nr:hypothetical protein [Nocardia otitidiscaviarum]
MSIYASNDEHGESNPAARIRGYIPTTAELTELSEAAAYSYQAGELPESFASEWVRDIATQPDGGLLNLIAVLADVRAALERHRNDSQREYAAIAAKQQRYARQHDVYRGALRDAARVFADLGVTNPPPRFVEALALEEIPR